MLPASDSDSWCSHYSILSFRNSVFPVSFCFPYTLDRTTELKVDTSFYFFCLSIHIFHVPAHLGRPVFIPHRPFRAARPWSVLDKFSSIRPIRHSVMKYTLPVSPNICVAAQLHAVVKSGTAVVDRVRDWKGWCKGQLIISHSSESLSSEELKWGTRHHILIT